MSKNTNGVVQKYYFLKENGEIDYSQAYDLIEETEDCKGLYYVCLDGHAGYMNEQGEVVIPIIYDIDGNSDWDDYDDQTMIRTIAKDNYVGLINNRGEELIPCIFDNVSLVDSIKHQRFYPIAFQPADDSNRVWGMYDIKEKRISVTPEPKYEDIRQIGNEYASFKKNGKWGLLHCATGTEVIPALYATGIYMPVCGTIITRIGEMVNWSEEVGWRLITKECHVWVVNGAEKTQLALSGYDYIEDVGSDVMKCKKNGQVDSFKILRMPNYIGIIKNALYEVGVLDNGKFTKKFTTDCASDLKWYAKYLSGGTFLAINYDGKNIPVTDEMRQEILKYISEE